MKERICWSVDGLVATQMSSLQIVSFVPLPSSCLVKIRWLHSSCSEPCRIELKVSPNVWRSYENSLAWLGAVLGASDRHQASHFNQGCHMYKYSVGLDPRIIQLVVWEQSFSSEDRILFSFSRIPILASPIFVFVS